MSHVLDRGMLTRLAELVRSATASFEAYDYTAALRDIEAFFWWFCDDHIEHIKASADDVFAALSTEKGLAAVWTEKLIVRPEPGFINEFDFNDGYSTKMKIVEFEPPLHIRLQQLDVVMTEDQPGRARARQAPVVALGERLRIIDADEFEADALQALAQTGAHPGETPVIDAADDDGDHRRSPGDWLLMGSSAVSVFG